MIAGVADATVLAVALSMDAAAVAAARGVAGLDRRDALRLAIALGLGPAILAGVGCALGAAASSWISAWDHWVAFGLLVLIGGKMLVEALRRDAIAAPAAAALSLRFVLVLALATSIDALAAGVTLPILAAPVVLSIALIGLASFAFSLLGALGARWIGQRGGRLLEVLGGVALIAIGTRTLVEHLR